MGGDHLWEAIGAIGEVVSAAGVIGTLIYLAIQIRANTKESRLTATGEVSREYNSCLQHITADAELSRIWLIGIDGDINELTDVERTRIIMAMGNIFRVLESAFIQYRSKRMAQASWEGYERIIRRGIDSSLFRVYWQLRRDMHSTPFRDMVEELGKQPDTEKMFG